MDNEVPVRRVNNIIFEQILIKKRRSIAPSVFEYPISYMTHQCIVQTPIVYIPFSTYKIENKISFDFYFLNLDIDEEMKLLKQFVKKIEVIAKQRIQKDIKIMKSKKEKKRKDLSFRAKEFISNIKYTGGCIPKPDRMRVNCYDNILTFNDKKENISIDYLKSKSYIKLLLSPSKIWINKDKYGVYWEVLQIKMYPKTVLNKYSFIDSDYKKYSDNDNTSQSTVSVHPIYNKYFDMIKKGVPKQAVKNKMLLDNLDPSIIDKPVSNNLSKCNAIMSNLHNDISNFKNLKSVKLQNKNINTASINKNPLFKELLFKSNNKNKILKTVKIEERPIIAAKNNGNYTPSLQEILNKKNNLNKINVDV